LKFLQAAVSVRSRTPHVSELKRLKDLEAENAKLKQMYADLALENTAIKDVLNRKL
jgi:putative transposase